jgi:tetratricopeptide (TPR) repeat protein
MAKRNSQKKKTKRKAKQKVRPSSQSIQLRLHKAEYFFYEAKWYRQEENYAKSLQLLRKALKIDPKNHDYNYELSLLGNQMDKPDIEFEGLSQLYRNDNLEDQLLPRFIDLLTTKENYELAIEMTDLLLERLSCMKIANYPGIHQYRQIQTQF